MEAWALVVHVQLAVRLRLRLHRHPHPHLQGSPWQQSRRPRQGRRERVFCMKRRVPCSSLMTRKARHGGSEAEGSCESTKLLVVCSLDSHCHVPVVAAWFLQLVNWKRMLTQHAAAEKCACIALLSFCKLAQDVPTAIHDGSHSQSGVRQSLQTKSPLLQQLLESSLLLRLQTLQLFETYLPHFVGAAAYCY